MKPFRSLALLCAIAALPGLGSAAELPVLDPSLSGPPMQYRSAFEDYRTYRDTPPADWRALNDEASRIGGHAGIAAGAKTSGPAQPATSKAAPAGPAHAH